jgi:predicted RNase H-like HicB family nuclease
MIENKYEVIIFWSAEDAVFVADVPELPGCTAHGASHLEALNKAQEAVELWMETARALGRQIPMPKGRRLLYA